MWWFSNGDIGKGSAGKEDGKEKESERQWRDMGNDRTYTEQKGKMKKVKHTYAYSIEAKKRE